MKSIHFITSLTILLSLYVALTINKAFPIEYYLVYNSIVLLLISFVCTLVLIKRNNTKQSVSMKDLMFNRNLIIMNIAIILSSYFLFFQGNFKSCLYFNFLYLINVCFVYWFFVVLFEVFRHLMYFKKIMSNLALGLLLIVNIINVMLIDSFSNSIPFIAFLSPMHGLFYIPLYNTPSYYYLFYAFLLSSVIIIRLLKSSHNKQAHSNDTLIQ